MRKTLLAAVFVTTSIWPQDSATIRVNTRLVEVDVVVHSKGKPVDNLRAADFSLFDEGKPQRIAAFAIRRDSNVPPVLPLAPGEISNRPNRLSSEPVAPTIILLDTLNSDPEDMFEARRHVAMYLERATPGAPIAIYALNRTLTVLHDFTGDPERLRKIVSRWAAPSSADASAETLITDLPATGNTLADGMTQAVAKEMTDMANLRRAEMTAFALETIAKHLSGLPGRKKLIWAGASFPARTSEQRSRLGTKQIETRDYTKYIDSAVRALNEAQVAVYPIDPRNPCKPTCLGSPLFHAVGIDTMNLIAGGTGGRAFYVLNDIAGAVQEAFEDSEITYMLGFYPEKTNLDGKYHDLKVKLVRIDAEVRYRRGYVAAESKPPAPAENQKLLRSAMEAPLEATAIGVSARFLPEQSQAALREFLLRIDVHELEMKTEQSKDGSPLSTASVTVATFFPADPKRAPVVSVVKLTFTERRLPEVLREGYLMRFQVDNGGAPGKVRVVVQDRNSGKAGSLTLDVP